MNRVIFIRYAIKYLLQSMFMLFFCINIFVDFNSYILFGILIVIAIIRLYITNRIFLSDIEQLRNRKEKLQFVEISNSELEKEYMRISKKNDKEFIKRNSFLSTLIFSKESLILVISKKESGYIVSQKNVHYI